MDTSKYKELFISESLEILTRLNKLLIDLEKDPQNTELLHNIFREAHTLKGMAASMGYENIVCVAHSMESAFDLFRNKRLLVEKESVNVILEAFDLLETLIGNMANKNAPCELKNVPQISPESLVASAIEKINKVIDKAKSENTENNINGAPVSGEYKDIKLTNEDRKIIETAQKGGLSIYKVSVILKPDTPMKQARAYVVLKTLDDIGQILYKNVIDGKIKESGFDGQFILFLATTKESQAIREKLDLIHEIYTVKIENAEPDEDLIMEEIMPHDSKKETSKNAEVRTIRVSVEHLDKLMNLVGELVINKVKLMNIGNILMNNELDEAIIQLNRLSDGLQNEVMTARLVPLSQIFDRFPRMIRDLAKEENKDIVLEMEGSSIGLDRTILDEINDPLIHLLRNAVNHGVESRQEREKKGKPQTGYIKIAARKERNFVLIEVSDDGAGIDTEEIKKTAIAKKIINEEDIAKLGEQDIIALITSPGFSTSKKVTETSGRGVGMNTVKTKAESFGGTLSIETTPGLGSKFTLKLPVSMAILQALIIEVDTEVYAVPLTNIVEVMKAEKALIKTMEHHEVIPYRDEVLPLIELRKKFGFRGKEETKNKLNLISRQERIPIVVVEVGHRRAGLVVDRILGNQEVVIKTLTGDLKKMKGVAGATIMGGGDAALIVDVVSIV